MNLLHRPWHVVFLIGFVLYVGIRHVFIRRTKANEKAISRSNTVEQVLLFLVFTGNLLLPMLYLFTPWLAFADYALPPFAPWCGTAIMVGALGLFWRSHVDLGLNWSVALEMRKQHELVRHGVYRSIRHPMYASIWLFGLAQALLLDNWLAGPSALITFAPLYLYRTPREEQMMRERFGQDYQEYIGRTGRMVPRLTSARPRETP